MDFEESEEEIAFRKEVRAWLDAHAPKRVAGEQSDRSYMPGDGDPDADERHLRACKQWQATLFDGGWAKSGAPIHASQRTPYARVCARIHLHLRQILRSGADAPLAKLGDLSIRHYKGKRGGG